MINMSDAVVMTSKGDYSKITRYLHQENRLKKITEILQKYGDEGVKALAAATPIKSGKTAASWKYRIRTDDANRIASLSFWNTNVNKGVPIALILQYGHGTGTGGYVEGRDYINPAIQPIFDKISEEVWKEVIAI